MPVVDAKNVSKAYGADSVLRDATVAIEANECVGVVGRNGAGKSTLARILTGTEAPDTGSVARQRGAAVLLLEQVPKFEGDPSAREAVESGLGAWSKAFGRHAAASHSLSTGHGDLDALLQEQATAAEEVERLGGFEQRHRVESLLSHLGVERVEARVSTLSGGEQRRVALARLLIARPDLAILDEPTNHLDAETIEWLEGYLVDEHVGAVMLITHDRYLLDRVATRTLEIADGEVHSYEGGYELYLEQKALRLEHAARVEQNRQNFLRRELEWLRRQPKARTTKQKARIDRAGAALAVQAPKDERVANFALDKLRSGKTILETRSLDVSLGGKPLVHALDLIVTEGDRIGIVGPNGSGKTTLLRTLLGELEPAKGSVTRGQNTRIAYFDQLRSGLEDDKSVFESVAGDQSRIELGGETIEPRSFLERFGFDSARQRQRVGSLSGGERARVAMARLLRQSANLVVMDEPTNDLDVATLGALESMLVEQGITALVVTHDRWFLDRVATSILAFEKGQRVVHYPGNYDAYRRLKAAADKSRAPEAAEARRTEKAEARRGDSKKKALTWAEERELEKLPDAIEAAERRVGELGETLADPATYAERGADVPELSAALEAAKIDVERLTNRWEELESKKL